MNRGFQSGDRFGVTSPASANCAQAVAPSQTKVGVSGASPHLRGANVRLREADACTLRRQCRQAGMSAAHYVSTLLVAVEEGRTQIAGKDAVAALAQSNYQLSWLGRNLRELLRKFEAPGLQQGSEANALSLLRDTIGPLTAHLSLASAVLADIQTTRCIRRRGAPRAQRSAGAKR